MSGVTTDHLEGKDSFGNEIQKGTYICTYSRRGAKIKYGKITSVTKRGYVAKVCDVDGFLLGLNDVDMRAYRSIETRLLQRRVVYLEALVITDLEKQSMIEKVLSA